MDEMPVLGERSPYQAASSTAAQWSLQSFVWTALAFSAAFELGGSLGNGRTSQSGGGIPTTPTATDKGEGGSLAGQVGPHQRSKQQ